jgi:KUP system potassium uptake protein
MVALATAATVIASQATISGAFSVTQQAVQLGFVPRMAILHTSERTAGQIYVPAVNWLLLAAVLAVVVGFGSSAELAQAYGVAVMGTMLATTFLTFFVIRYSWKLPLALCLAATGFFFAIEATLLSAALTKILEGGWLPLAIGSVVAALMLTWRRGRALMAARLRQTSVPLSQLVQSLMRDAPVRVPGTAVFLTAAADAAPHALLHNLNHNKVLHERVVFLTLEVLDEPHVEAAQRIALERMEHGFWRMRLRYGFMQQPDVAYDLTETSRRSLPFDMMTTSFFLSRQMIVPAEGGRGVGRWSMRVFAAMVSLSGNAADYMNLPPNRVIELGTKVQV